MPSRRRRWPRVLAVIAVALVALVLLWDWNWFRPLVEAQASAALNRRVTLGHFDLRLSRHPLVLLDRIDIANPKDGFPANTSTATVGRLAIRLDLFALFHHGVILEQVVVDQPDADLERTADGLDNWTFGSQPAKPAPQPSPWKVDVGSLVINDGRVHVIDPKLKSDFTLAVHTQANPARKEPDLYVGIQGRYSGQPIDGRFIGGSVLSLRGDETHVGSNVLEMDACAEQGLVLANYPIGSRDAPDKKQVKRIVELFREMPKPLLLHCKSGADRAGLVSAIYLLTEKNAPVDEAIHELRFWPHGHVRQAKTGILDHFLDTYREHYRAHGTAFMDWIEHHYDRQAVRDSFHSSWWANRLVDGILRRE